MPLTDDRAGDDRHGRFLRGAATAIVVVTGAALLAAAIFSGNSAPAGRAASHPGTTTDDRYLHVNDLVLKADLAEKLPYTPAMIILGGSRSLRFEPRYIEKKTGLPAFNAGVRNGRPEEAWGLTHFLHDLFPKVRPRYLWFVHVKVLRAWGKVSPALVLDPRYSRYFPDSFLEEQGKLMGPGALRPYRSKQPAARFADDGRILWSQSDTTTLQAQGIPNTVIHWNRTNGAGTPTIEERPREWFEKTLGYMNDDLDAAPLIVMMPMQPEVLKEIGASGFWDSYAATMDYLHSLRGTYRFRLADFTLIDSFNGDPQNFYDGYHPRIENTHRIIDELLRRWPHAFD
jgi:hypothetical protein